MRGIAVFLMAVVLAAGCSKPEDIVLGPEPMKQIADQGDKFKQLPESDRALLVAYLTVNQMGKAFGADVKSPTGRTVGEVLIDARAWQEKMKAAEAEAKKKAAEAEALKARILAERQAIMERIASAVTVAVVGTRVLPKNYDIGRYYDLLSISYAIENKSDKGIKQLKGTVEFKDATGDKVGDLPVNIEEPIAAGKTAKTDTGRGWRLNQFSNGDIERIASRPFSSLTATFTPESIAFEGGEVLKAPEAVQ